MVYLTKLLKSNDAWQINLGYLLNSLELTDKLRIRRDSQGYFVPLADISYLVGFPVVDSFDIGNGEIVYHRLTAFDLFRQCDSIDRDLRRNFRVGIEKLFQMELHEIPSDIMLYLRACKLDTFFCNSVKLNEAYTYSTIGYIHYNSTGLLYELKNQQGYTSRGYTLMDRRHTMNKFKAIKQLLSL